MNSIPGFGRQQPARVLRRFEGPADLHLHSNHSDGTDTPTDVIRRAYEHGVRTVALTDHDRTSGWDEAGDIAAVLGMTFLPGIELSARHGPCTLHILGYLFDPADPALRDEAARIRLDRTHRAERIVRNISKDYDLGWADVVAQSSPGATIGRPHIADALVARGIVRTRSEAFESILAETQQYYETLYAPETETAVRLITEAGGVAIIAHPAASGADGLMPTPDIERLIAAGLGGFELGHRDNAADAVQRLRRIVAAHDLIVTGSSDYHGRGKPNRPGEHTTTDEMVSRLIARASGATPRYPRASTPPTDVTAVMQ